MASLSDLLAAPGFADLNPAERRASIQKVAPNLPELNDDEIEHIRQRVVASRAAPKPISIPMYSTQSGRPQLVKDVGAGGPLTQTEQTLTNIAGLPMVAGGAMQFGRGLTRAGLTPEAEGQDPSFWEKVGGYSDMIRGLAGATAPLSVPLGLAKYPVMSLLGLGGGYLGSQAERIPQALGAPEGLSEAVGTTFGTLGGALPFGLGFGPRVVSGMARSASDRLGNWANTSPMARTAAKFMSHAVVEHVPAIPGLRAALNTAIDEAFSKAPPPSAKAEPTSPAGGEPIPMDITGTKPGTMSTGFPNYGAGLNIVHGAPSKVPGASVSKLTPAAPAPPSAIGGAPLGSTGTAVTPLQMPDVPPSAVGGAPIGATGAVVHPVPAPAQVNIPSFPFGGSTGDVGVQGPVPAGAPASAVGRGPFGGATGDLLRQIKPATGAAAAPKSAVGAASFGTSGTAGGPVGELQSGTALGTWYGGIPEPGVPKGETPPPGPQKGTPVNPVDKMDRTALNATLHSEAQDLDIAPVGGLRGAGPKQKVPSGFMDIVAKDKFGKPYRDLSDDQLRQMINDRTLHNYKVK